MSGSGQIGAVFRVTILKNPSGDLSAAQGGASPTALKAYEEAIAGNTGAGAEAWNLTSSPAIPPNPAVKTTNYPCVTSLSVVEGVGAPPTYKASLVVPRGRFNGDSRWDGAWLYNSAVLETGNIMVAQIAYPAYGISTRLYKGICGVPEVDDADDGFITATITASGFAVFALQATVGKATFKGMPPLAVMNELATAAGFTTKVDVSRLNQEAQDILNAPPKTEKVNGTEVPGPYEVIGASQTISSVLQRIAKSASCAIVYVADDRGAERIQLVPFATVVAADVKKRFVFRGAPRTGKNDHIGYGFKTESDMFWMPGLARSKLVADIDAKSKKAVTTETGGGVQAVPSTGKGARANIAPKGADQKTGVAQDSAANTQDPQQAQVQAGAASELVSGAVGITASWSTPGYPLEIFERVDVTGIGQAFDMQGGFVIQSTSHTAEGGQWTTEVTAYATGVPGHAPATIMAPPVPREASHQRAGVSMIRPEEP